LLEPLLGGAGAGGWVWMGQCSAGGAWVSFLCCPAVLSMEAPALRLAPWQRVMYGVSACALLRRARFMLAASAREPRWCHLDLHVKVPGTKGVGCGMSPTPLATSRPKLEIELLGSGMPQHMLKNAIWIACWYYCGPAPWAFLPIHCLGPSMHVLIRICQGSGMMRTMH
jgi:hypothetical protein